MIVNGPVRNDTDKKKDIKTSQNKQEFATSIQLSPVVANAKVAWDSYEIIQKFIEWQIALRKQTQDIAIASEQTVTKPQ